MDTNVFIDKKIDQITNKLAKEKNNKQANSGPARA